MAQRVVPGFCRHALEAASLESVRRRRILRGDSHGDVEAAIARATTVSSYLALALFDDEARAGEAVRELYDRYGPKAGDVAKAVNRGVHDAVKDDLRDLVRETGRLARRVAEIP